MSGMDDVKDHEHVHGVVQGSSQDSMPSSQQEEAVKKKYGGILPKKPPLISKDHERAYFDSADWALGKQSVEKPKGPLEALRPKLQVMLKNKSHWGLDLDSPLVAIKTAVKVNKGETLVGTTEIANSSIEEMENHLNRFRVNLRLLWSWCKRLFPG